LDHLLDHLFFWSSLIDLLPYKGKKSREIHSWKAFQALFAADGYNLYNVRLSAIFSIKKQQVYYMCSALKSKILGKGGDRRFHGKIVDSILHFPGKQTTH